MVTHTEFPSSLVPSRDIYVWLPEGYTHKQSYDVLYMHDGQGLFDSAVTWNKQEWGIDETATELMLANRVRPFIVVAIPSIGNGLRHREYFPEKPWRNLSDQQRDSVLSRTRYRQRKIFVEEPQSDNYLKFLVTELKPFIDKTYSVNKGREHTFMMGSSMGGLISIYALNEYPDVFAGVACLSTHWVGIFDMDNNPIPATLNNYLSENLPSAGNHRIYFDHGTEDLDALYSPLQIEVDKIMRQKGYSERDWLSLVAEGKNHSENAWRERLSIPLLFLLGSRDSLDSQSFD